MTTHALYSLKIRQSMVALRHKDGTSAAEIRAHLCRSNPGLQFRNNAFQRALKAGVDSGRFVQTTGCRKYRLSAAELNQGATKSKVSLHPTSQAPHARCRCVRPTCPCPALPCPALPCPALSRICASGRGQTCGEENAPQQNQHYDASKTQRRCGAESAEYAS